LRVIVSGNYINQLESGSNSTLTAILGREAASRQEKITWDELLYSAQEIDHGLNLKQFTAK